MHQAAVADLGLGTPEAGFRRLRAARASAKMPVICLFLGSGGNQDISGSTTIVSLRPGQWMMSHLGLEFRWKSFDAQFARLGSNGIALVVFSYCFPFTSYMWYRFRSLATGRDQLKTHLVPDPKAGCTCSSWVGILRRGPHNQTRD